MIARTALLALLIVSPASLAAQELNGVWRGTEVVVINGPNAGTTQVTRTRLLMYGDAYFMWAFELEGDDRPLLPPAAEATDGQVARVARQYQSTAGTYIRDGNRLLYNRLVSLVPNDVVPENQVLVREIRTLTKDLLETQVTNADGVTTVLRYERVE